MSKTPKHLRCGVQLKTKACERSAWWPGGRCPQHGHGAETLVEWARGMAKKEAGPYDAYFEFGEHPYGDPKDSKISWSVRNRYGYIKFWAGGELTLEEAVVLGDQLAAEGVLNAEQMQTLGKTVARILRKQSRKSGKSAQIEALAQAYRRKGYTASSSEEYLYFPLADAERLLDALEGKTP